MIVETHSDYLIDRVRMDVRDEQIKAQRCPDPVLRAGEGDGVKIHPIEIDAAGRVVGVPAATGDSSSTSSAGSSASTEVCAIVDANVAGRFFSRPPDPELLPLWKWIDDGKSILVVGGRLRDELEAIGRAAEQIRIWAQAGLVGFVAPERKSRPRPQASRGTGLCVSDDEHVIALARASGARLLCSEDQLLHADFRNRDLISGPRGAVYQNATHAHLLEAPARLPIQGTRRRSLARPYEATHTSGTAASRRQAALAS